MKERNAMQEDNDLQILRTELLHLAKEILTEQLHASLSIEADIVHTYTVEDVITVASKLFNFVTNNK